jgi:hypothetical protein
MNTNKLHIVDQSGQPYGSVRRCCNKCGLSVYAFGDGDKYAEHPAEYTREIAQINSTTRCCDFISERYRKNQPER